MKIYASRIPQIAEEVIRSLRDSEAIDVMPEMVPEAELDAQGVLREYLRVDRDLTTRAREASEQGRGSFGRVKKQLAYQANFKIGDEGIDYIADQLIETFLHSQHVDEIFADDRDLRLHISKVLKKHLLEQDSRLDEEVRDRIKNLQEGSVAWDDEYSRVMQEIKRRKNLK